VLYVLTAAFGLEMTLGGQLRWLRGAGFEPYFACAPGEESARFAASEGVPGEAIPIEREIRPLKDLRALWKLWRLMRRLRPQITNVSAPKGGLLGGLAAWLAGVPCRVYTLRGLRLETATGVEYLVLWLAERLACRLAQRILCVSPGLAERVVELRLARRERLIVPGSGSSNGVDAHRFAPAPAMAERARCLRRRLAIPEGVPVLGFAGRLTRDKGIAELVAAYQRLRERYPPLRLLLVGCFENGDPVPAAVRDTIDRDPGILVTGFVQDVAPYYQLMDVVALPSYREGYPTLALEAAAACRPFVTTCVTGAADTVADGETGLLVPPRDARALSAAVNRLLEDPARAAEMARRAQRVAVTEFAPERVWKAFERVYRDLLAEHLLAGTLLVEHCADPGAGDSHAEASSRLARGASSWALGVGKRIFDIVAACSGLVAAAPLLLAAAGMIRLLMGRPILFRQSRAGLAGRPFLICKFRTMTVSAPSERHSRDTAGDAEGLPPAGRLLRRWSIDELPQLWNVLRGEMSLVGPRPLPVRYRPRYTEHQRRRHDVRPGITGWAQVRGRNSTNWHDRFELDLWYVAHASLALDLRILLESVVMVVSGYGVTAPGGLLMPEFLAEGHAVSRSLESCNVSMPPGRETG
jgi:lipopolysaccharide/colanic/teichoic acid biosynthesis glycosyltransferase/glycosyltransferase involved in cell wall biosynthesis